MKKKVEIKGFEKVEGEQLSDEEQKQVQGSRSRIRTTAGCLKRVTIADPLSDTSTEAQAAKVISWYD